MPRFEASLFSGISRTGYWVSIVALMLVLAGLSLWLDLYRSPQVEVGGETRGGSMRHTDPLTELLYSPLGLIVVLTTFHFFAANVLLWGGLAGWRSVFRRGV